MTHGAICMLHGLCHIAYDALDCNDTYVRDAVHMTLNAECMTRRAWYTIRTACHPKLAMIQYDLCYATYNACHVTSDLWSVTFDMLYATRDTPSSARCMCSASWPCAVRKHETLVRSNELASEASVSDIRGFYPFVQVTKLCIEYVFFFPNMHNQGEILAFSGGTLIIHPHCAYLVKHNRNPHLLNTCLHINRTWRVLKSPCGLSACCIRCMTRCMVSTNIRTQRVPEDSRMVPKITRRSNTSV